MLAFSSVSATGEVTRSTLVGMLPWNSTVCQSRSYGCLYMYLRHLCTPRANCYRWLFTPLQMLPPQVLAGFSVIRTDVTQMAFSLLRGACTEAQAATAAKAASFAFSQLRAACGYSKVQNFTSLKFWRHANRITYPALHSSIKGLSSLSWFLNKDRVFYLYIYFTNGASH